MRDIFLYDNDRAFSYNDLLEAINYDEMYCPYYRTSDIFLFFVNLIKGLILDQPLVLLDYDINVSEIKDIDVCLLNKKKKCRYSTMISMNDVISSINRSKSEITIFTSGTTGQPKKVIHNIKSLTRSVRIGERYKDQVWAFAYNPAHMAGLQVFFQALENQNTLVNVFNFQREYILRQIVEKRITHISATPTFYRLLQPFEEAYENVVRVTLGGEKSDTMLYDSIKRMFPFAKINNVYASTEAGSLFAAEGDCFQIPESFHDMIKVQDNELLIHSSLLGKSESYHLTDNYYHSGDIIEWVDEAKGLFRFKSRKNELINIGGYKVNPNEIESLILKIDGVLQAVVYGKSNSILGNVLCADIILVDGKELTEIDIRKILSTQIQDYKVPRRIRFVKEISLTRTGKLKRI